MTLLLEQPGPHEEQLRAFCEPFEVPADAAPSDKPICIMLFSNRSGSSLISEHMRASPYFGGFGEPLNYKFVTEQMSKDGEKSFLGYLQKVHRQHADEHKLFGMKASGARALAAHLGVADAEIDAGKVSTRKQRGDRNAEFRERFLAEYRESILA